MAAFKFKKYGAHDDLPVNKDMTKNEEYVSTIPSTSGKYEGLGSDACCVIEVLYAEEKMHQRLDFQASECIIHY